MTETLKYAVLKRANGVELRRYPGHTRAEEEVAGLTYQQAIYQGFSVLAGYIFGDNIDTEKIAMTSPVQVSNLKNDPNDKTGHRAQGWHFIGCFYHAGGKHFGNTAQAEGSSDQLKNDQF